ncbi:hypothetical protein D3C71_1469990 [compost metagenome]
MVDPADHVTAAFIEPAGPQVVVLGFEHDAREFLLATPELRHIQQGLGHAVPSGRCMHRQFVDMGKTVPVGTDHQVPHGLVIQVGHENRAVGGIAKAAELLRVDAVALAVRRDRRHRPLRDRFADFSRTIGRDFKTEITAPDVGGKTFIGNPYRQPWVIRIYNRLHTGKGPHSLMQSTV